MLCLLTDTEKKTTKHTHTVSVKHKQAMQFNESNPVMQTTHTHTYNRFTALWNLSGTTRVSRYQKKHSPTTLIVVINHPYLLYTSTDANYTKIYAKISIHDIQITAHYLDLYLVPPVPVGTSGDEIPPSLMVNGNSLCSSLIIDTKYVHDNKLSVRGNKNNLLK